MPMRLHTETGSIHLAHDAYQQRMTSLQPTYRSSASAEGGRETSAAGQPYRRSPEYPVRLTTLSPLSSFSAPLVSRI